MPAKKLLLASGSPHRARLLSAAGFDFVQQATRVDESFAAELSVQQNVENLAIVKAQAAHKSKQFADKGNVLVILAADTVVVNSKKQVLTKARNAQQAADFLRSRSASFEHVVSGYCLLANNKLTSGSVTTKITYKPIPLAKQREIIASGEWQGVCGGLKVEGLVKNYVQKIEGDKHNIIGLPIKLISDLFEGFGVFPRSDGIS